MPDSTLCDCRSYSRAIFPAVANQKGGQLQKQRLVCHVADGRTERELEILGHVAHGRSNAEIAAQLFLGENTVMAAP